MYELSVDDEWDIFRVCYFYNEKEKYKMFREYIWKELEKQLKD